MTAEEQSRDDIAVGIYYALFKVVSVADLEDSDRAVEWARSALEDKSLLRAFVDRTAQRAATGVTRLS
jgi:hypothetical protein